jgi:sulfofructose kinase
MFDVLGIGVATVDDLVRVPRYPAPDTKIRITGGSRACGGLCATALMAAARLGAHAAYAGVLGFDEPSEFVLRCLAAEGIDIDHVTRLAESGPAHSIIIVDEEHGTRTVLSDSRSAAVADGVVPEDAILRGARVLLVDHVRLAASLRAAQIARAAGVTVVADLERDDHPLVHVLLPNVDHLVISRAFGARLTGVTDPERAALALRAPGRSIVLTGGAGGAWYLGPEPGEVPRWCAAFDVAVVDTTGCGDVFHGAYAAGLAFGLDLDQRVRLACAAAALKATQPGGQAGIPTRHAVETLLGETSRR